MGRKKKCFKLKAIYLHVDGFFEVIQLNSNEEFVGTKNEVCAKIRNISERIMTKPSSSENNKLEKKEQIKKEEEEPTILPSYIDKFKDYNSFCSIKDEEYTENDNSANDDSYFEYYSEMFEM